VQHVVSNRQIGLLLILHLCLCSIATGHGHPIDMAVNGNGKLFTDEIAYESALTLVAGAVLTTTVPGYGVESSDQGLAAGDVLELEAVRELLFWSDGTVKNTTSTLVFDGPLGDSSYTITSNSGQQTGLQLGTYDGSDGWHQHGDYTLLPPASSAGAYGLVLRISAAGYGDSGPFLIVFNNGLSDEDFHQGLAAIQAVAFTTGDFDRDGDLDVSDIQQLMAAISTGSDEPTFDTDGTWTVDIADLRFWVEELKHTWFGDANLDGQFNSTDLVLVLAEGEYEDVVAGNSNWASGDWDGDGDFTTADLVTALAGGGYELGPRAAINSVPEPASDLLLALGTLVLTFSRRAVRGHKW
jgi:hypothetical protein